MQTILGIAVLASFAFVGTMIDDFFAFAAQLLVTEPIRRRRISLAQAGAVAAIVALAGGLSSLLEPLPLRWVGLVAIAPFAFAVHGWRHRATPREQFRRGGLTTFVLTLGLGGDNVAVWLPLLRATNVLRATVTIGTFALWEVTFLIGSRRLAKHPRAVRWGNQHAATVLPYLYALLGVLVLVECRTF
ncbi:MAG: cadmium resistance transporter [Acidimicrobiales bacterium]